MKLALIPLRSEIALSRACIALLLFETSLKKILCKFNLKSFLEAYFHEIVIRSLLTLYGVTWRLSGLTLNPELACSISYLSSGAGGNECITNGLCISQEHPLLCFSSLVYHPITRWQAIAAAFDFIGNCSIRGAFSFGLPQRLWEPHCQNTCRTEVRLIQPNSLQLSWATLSSNTESPNCVRFLI